MKKLLGNTLDELKEIAKSLGMPAFTGGQIAKWIYEKRVTSIDEMTNLSKQNREKLAAEYEVGFMPPCDAQHSKDGTIKYLFPVCPTPALPPRGGSQRHDSAVGFDSQSNPNNLSAPVRGLGGPGAGGGLRVETVFIPDHDRATLCVSCQVGCKMNCLFCQTGKQGWQGDLTAADILNQIFALPEHDRLTNIVFMGQGEPMDNLDAVLKATEILKAPWGLAWSPKRITVSSVGIKNKLKRFLDESDCHVAISMHTPIHEQRQQIMPAEKAMSIQEVVELLKQYPAFRALKSNKAATVLGNSRVAPVPEAPASGKEETSRQRRLTFEYTMFRGVNDSITHAKEILKLLRGLDCRINLIRYHKIPDIDLQGCDQKTMENFRDYLNAHGITTTIRASRGEDIYAACGLLNTAKHKAP